MDEESSMSSFDNQENEEVLMNKENQRSSRINSDDELDEEQRRIFEQQQYQRSQFYEQQQTYRQSESTFNEDDDRSPAEPFQSQDVERIEYECMKMDEELSNKSIESVPEYLVDKINNEKWENVNGQYDKITGEWREWHEITTAVSYNNEILTILPYVTSTINDYVSLNISC